MVRVRKNIFEELDKVRNLIKIRFPDFEIRDFSKFMSKLGSYHYNKKKFMLLGKEREIYFLLIENSYNPFTVYRWTLLERVPEDIKFHLRNHNLGQKKAIKLFLDRKHETETSLQISIKQLGLHLVRWM